MCDLLEAGPHQAVVLKKGNRVNTGGSFGSFRLNALNPPQSQSYKAVILRQQDGSDSLFSDSACISADSNTCSEKSHIYFTDVLAVSAE